MYVYTQTHTLTHKMHKLIQLDSGSAGLKTGYANSFSIPPIHISSFQKQYYYSYTAIEIHAYYNRYTGIPQLTCKYTTLV